MFSMTFTETDKKDIELLINIQFLMIEHLASYPRLSSTSTGTFTYYVHDNTHERPRKGMLQVTLYNSLLIRS
jgi:hypothetical protein